MEKTLLSRKSLAERWDFDSTDVIAKYEREGIITRVSKIPYPRYSVEEIEGIENIKEINPLSPLERKRLENKIEKLELKINRYEDIFRSIKENIFNII